MTQKLDLSVDEVLTTTRAVRKRIDFEKPIERSVLSECIEAALQSPTGGNQQGWQWLLVTDPEKRAAIADVYRKGWKIYREKINPAVAGESAQMGRVGASAQYMADNFERYPAMLIPCIGRLPENPKSFEMASRFGSILPGVWSFMLAARERGLGTTWTTIHLMYESEVAEILSIPDTYMQCALVTVGYTMGTEFKPALRGSSENVTHWNGWGGA